MGKPQTVLLHELHFRPLQYIEGRYAKFKAKGNRTVFVTEFRDGRWMINVQQPHKTTEKWKDMDALTAQAVLFEITSQGKTQVS